jgi:hypothetical protein
VTKHIITGCDEIIGPWVANSTGGQWYPGRGTAIGLGDSEKGLLAAALFEDFNGANINMHVSAVPGRSWLNREFLWFCFYYPFVQLGATRITGLVHSGNAEARRFDEHLGFVLEATLKDAVPGGDLLVYKMTKADCRWLNLRRKVDRGQSQFADAERQVGHPA